MNCDLIKRWIPSAPTAGIIFALILLLVTSAYFANKLAVDVDFDEIHKSAVEKCEKYKSIEDDCEAIEIIEQSFEKRISYFRDSAKIWGQIKTTTILTAILFGVITSIYISNSSGKNSEEVSRTLRALGSAAALITPTLIGVYGVLDISKKSEELRSIAVSLIDLNNKFSIERCAIAKSSDPKAGPEKTKYCPLSNEEQDIIAAFSKLTMNGLNAGERADLSKLSGDQQKK